MPRFGSRQQQIGYVGARDEQNEHDPAHQRDERFAVATAHIGKATLRQYNAERPSRIFALILDAPMLRDGLLERRARNRGHAHAGLPNVDAWCITPNHAQPPHAACVQIPGPGADERQRTERHVYVGLAADICTAERGFRNPYDLERPAIEANRLADNPRRRCVFALPEPVSQHGQAGATANIVGPGDQTFCGSRDLKGLEVFATDKGTGDASSFATLSEVERCFAKRSDGTKGVLPIAHLLPERIREHGETACARLARTS